MSYIGMGVSPPAETGGGLDPFTCLQQGKPYLIDGKCLSLSEYMAKLCAEQIGGAYNQVTGECEMKASTGVSEVAAKMACESVGGTWNPEATSCAWPVAPPIPGQPPSAQPPPAQPPPAGKSEVPWGTVGTIAVGLSLLYVFARGR